MVVLALVLTFKALSSVFDIITWLPYFILQRPDQAMRRSRRLKVSMHRSRSLVKAVPL